MTVLPNVGQMVQASFDAMKIENDNLRAEIASLREQLKASGAEPHPPIPVSWGLTRTEARLLEPLMRRECVGRESMMDFLYGHCAMPPGDKIIDVFVCKIRKKLAPLGASIASRWGFGYYIPPDERAMLKRLAEEARV
jgi:DNA-binding response OmpR family regulator